MRKSFVLRDGKGHICGYLMIEEEQAACRCSLPDAHKTLCLFSEYGAIERHDFGKDETEGTWHCEQKRIVAAAIAAGESLLADTGETARKAFQLMCLETKRRESEAQKSAESTSRANEEQPIQCEEVEERIQHVQEEAKQTEPMMIPEKRWAQRRWPPPVLMENAEYHEGAWGVKSEADM